jgi:hypothetical protein
MNRKVKLRRDVDTSVGIYPAGLTMVATPADDGSYLLHLSLPTVDGQVRTERVPGEWVHPC